MSRRNLPSRNVMLMVAWCACALGVIGWAGLANAQNLPLAGSGYDQNMVVGANETFASAPITATMDGGTSKGGNTWYQVGQNAAAPTTGLPMGTSFTVTDPTTGGDTFQFQGIDTNNAILLANDNNGSPTGTFTLAQPGTCTSLSFLASDGNGGATVDVTLNYLNGSTGTAAIAVGDWFNNTPIAWNANGRISSGGYDNVNNNNPRLYYYDLTGLPTTSPLESISFQTTVGVGSNTHTAIMGISGNLVVAGITWTGATSNVWSLAGSDTNWNTPSQAYTDGSPVIFSSSGANTNPIQIASAVSPASVTFTNGATPYAFSGAAISGTASVTLGVLAGSVTFNSPNAYSGGTTVNGGTLTAAADAALGSGPLSLNFAGMVNFTSPAPTVNGLGGSGGSIVLGNPGVNATALTVNSNANSTYAGAILEAQGPSSLTKNGPNTLTLTGNGSYTGGTTVNQGALAAGFASLGTGTVTINNGAKLSLTQGCFSTMQLNNGAGAAATLSGGTLMLTNNTGGQANSAFTKTTLPITAAGFTASFVYTMPAGNANPADGWTFCIQNTSPTSVGGGGGLLGYNAINNSAAVCFNVYPGNGGSGTQFGYDYSGGNSLPSFGAAGQISTTSSVTANSVNLASGDPIQVTLSYDGASNLTETLFDPVTLGTFTYTFTNANFQTYLGGQAGYVGFTAGTGGAECTQDITNFQFTGLQYPSIVIPASAASELNFAAAGQNFTTVSGVTLGSGATLNVTSSAAANSAYQISAGTTALLGNVTINVANNGTGLGTFAPGVVSGAGNVTKGGPGTLLLASANSFVGNTIINAGNVAVTSQAGIGAAGNTVTINGGAYEIATGFVDTTPITFAGGALQVDAGQTYSNNTTFAVANGGAVTKTGAGTLYMTIPLPNAPVVANGGTFDLGGLSHTVTTATFTSGIVQNGTLSAASYLFNGPATVSATLQDGTSPSVVTVNNSGGGTSTLSGTNTYSGGTVITQGVLAAGVLSLGSSTITLNGGTFHPLGAAPGLVAQYYGPNIYPGTFNQFQNAQNSYLNFTTVYLPGAGPVTLTNNIIANVAGGANGTFNFDSIGEGALFPGQFGYGAPLNAGGNVPGTQVNDWTASYTGYFYAKTTGTYTFATNSDDNSRLWINGPTADTAVVINGINGQGWAGYGAIQASGTVSLVGGQYYPITIGYEEGGGGFGLEAFYAPPGTTIAAGDFLPVSLLTTSLPVNNNVFANNVAVTANSTLDLTSNVTFGFGTLTIGANTLQVTGGPGTATFAAATVANSVFNVQGSNVLSLNNVAGTLGFSTTGTGALVLTGAGTFTGAATANGGNLVVVGQNLTTGPLGGAPVTLTNGTLWLAGTSTAAATFDPVAGNPVTLTPGTTDSIIAGSTVAGVAGGTVILGGSGLAVPAGTQLNLGYVNGYTLTVNTVFSNSGTIAAATGNNVSLQQSNLSAAAGTLSANSGGTLTMVGPISSGTYSPAAGGIVYLSGAYSGPLANLTPQAGGALVIANNASSGTLSIAGGAYVATNNSSFGPATLALDGGTLAAAQNVTLANALTWGATPSIYFGGTSTMTLTSSLSVASGPYNLYDPAGVATLSGAISGGGTLNVNGNSTLSGPITTAGLNIAGNALLSGPITAGAVNISGNPTLSGVIGGSGSVTISTGTAILANANTYSGGTTLNAGANPTITNDQAFGTGTITFNGGGFNAAVPLQGNMAIANPWAIASGSTAEFNGTNPVELSGNASLPKGTTESLQLTNAGMTVTLSGLISGSGQLVRVANPSGQVGGTLVMNNPNSTFSGGFYLQSGGGYVDVHGASSVVNNNTGAIVSGPLGIGTITLGANGGGGNLGISNNGAVPATLANQLNINDNATYQSVAGLTFTGPINLTGTGSINFSIGPNSNITLAGNINATTNGINLSTGSGAGGLTLSGANLYTGPTSITMGTLIAGADSPDNGTGNPNGGAFGNATSAITIGDANSGANPAALVTGGAFEIDRPITVNANAGPTTLGGITADAAAGGSVFAGTITLNRNVTLSAAANGSVVFAGLNSYSATPVYGTITGSGGITAASAGNGNVSLVGANSYLGPTTVASGQLTLDYSNSASLIVSGGPSVGGIIPQSSTAPVILSGGTLNIIDNGSFIPVNETFASTQVANYGSTVVFTINSGGGAQINLNAITRSGGVLDLPVGTAGYGFTTTNTNSSGILGGYMTVNGFTDWAANDGSGNIAPFSSVSSYNTDDYGAPANNVDVTDLTKAPTSSATVNSLRFNTTPAGTLTLGGTLTVASGGILVTPNLGTHAVTISGGALTGPSTTSSSNTLADVCVIQGNTTTPFTISSPIIDNGSTPIALTKGGPGELILTGPNTYTGGTTITAGILQMGTGQPGQDSQLTGNVNNNGAFVFNLAGNQTYGGTISGGGSFTKGGTGTLALTGTQGYSGATTLSAGVLQLKGALLPAAGSELWLNANDLSKMTFGAGNAITAWASETGSGNTVTGNGTYTPNVINGQAVVQFTNSQMMFNTVAYNSPVTIFAVDRLYDLNSNQRIIGGYSNNFLLGNWGGGMDNFYYNGWVNQGGTAPDTNAHIWVGYVGTGGTDLSTAGVIDARYPTYHQFAANTGGTQGPQGIELNGYNNGNEKSDADVAELLVYSGSLSAAQTAQTEAYLETKYFGSGNTAGSNLLPITTPLTIASGATLDLDGASQQLASLSDSGGSGGAVINSNASGYGNASTLTLSPNGGSSTFSGTIGGSTQGPISLAMSGNGTQLLAGSLQGTGSLSVTSGLLELGGVNPMVGITTLSGGTLQVNNPLALEGQTLTVNVLDAGTLTTASGLSGLTLGGLAGNRNLSLAAIPLTIGANGASTTYAGNLSGPTSLTKTGAGTLFLSGTNSNGPTIVQSGILDAQQASALSGYASAGSVSVAGGASLNIQTGNVPIGWNNGQIGTLLSNANFAANSTLGLDTTSANVTYGGSISSPVTLNKLGANTLTLTASNNYTGGTIVSTGALTAANDAALGTGPLTVTLGARANFPSANPSVGGLSGAGSVVLGNAGVNATSLTVNSNANSTFSGVISEAQGPSSVTKAGPNALTLTGNNTYTGYTTVAAGTLVALPSNIGTGPLNLSGGTFAPPSTATPGLAVSAYMGCATQNGNASPTSVYNTISGINTFTASVPLEFTGTTIGSGGVNFPDQNAPTCGFQNIGFTGVPAPGTPAYIAQGGANQAGGQANDYTVVLSGYINLPAGTTTFSTQSDDGSNLFIDGNLVVNNNNFQGMTTVSGTTISEPTAGPHQITIVYYQGGGGNGLFASADANASGTDYLVNGTGLGQVYSGSLLVSYSNPVNVTQNSAISLPASSLGVVAQFPTMSIGANTLTVNGGAAGGGVAITGATTLTDAATFNVASPAALTFAGAVGGNGSLTETGNGLVVLAANNNYSGTTTINGGTLQIGNGGSTGTWGAGPITTNATLAFNRGDTPTITQTIGGSGGVANIGAGTVTLSGPNTYQGGTNIVAGAMTAASNTAFGTGVVSVAASATANFITASPSVGGLSGPGNVVLGNAPSTATNLTVNSAVSSTFSGVVSDAVAGLGSLTKAGPGTLTLGNTSTYGGATNINQGTLQMQAGLPGLVLPSNFNLNGTTVNGYQTNFNSPTLSSDWKFISGSTGNGTEVPNPGYYTEVQAGNGSYYLHVTEGQGDPNHMLYIPAGMNPSGNYTVLALVQPNITGIERGGICAAVNTSNNEGIDLLLGGNQGSVSALYDFVSWGPAAVTPYNNYSAGTKYWMQETVTNGTSATFQFWPADGTTSQSSATPLNWTFPGPTATGYAGIQASSGGALDMNVYYELIENSQLPTITVGAGSGALPATTTVTVAHAANWDLNGTTQTVASLSDGSGGGGNVINGNAGSASVLTLTPTGSTTFSGTIGDNGTGNSPGSIALVLDGLGTMVLSGTNSYAGGTTVLNGTLVVSNNEGLLDGSNLSVGNDLSAFPGAVAAAVPASSAPSAGAALSAVPEPGTLALLTAGLVVGFVAWRRKKGI